MEKWYYCPGAGKIKGHRLTIAERIKIWWHRRHYKHPLWG